MDPQDVDLLVSTVVQSGSIVAGIRAWRSEPVQAVTQKIADKYPLATPLVWDALHGWVRFALPFLVSAAASAGQVYAGHQSPKSALVAAVGAAVGALGGHHGTKWVGKLTAPAVERLPKPVRFLVELLVPVPK